ncbi:MAG: isocitrate lyase/PEP mutase family protein [Armatimonadota bacterium]
MELSYGARLRREVGRETLPFIGVYDVFSATVAARHFTGLFISGFGFAASYYGLPDIGFIAWSDMAAYVGRLRTVLPQCHLLVDIDDGYCDSEVACHVAALMEAQGASGVVLEDQLRPRKCGHYSGKQLMGLPEYLAKLERVLAARRELFVVARTDACEPEEMLRRAAAFADAGADAVLVDAIPDLDMLRALKARVNRPIVCNQLAGGKSPAWSLTELGEAGVSLVIYSTPCLFAAQEAIEDTLVTLKEQGGRLLQGITSRVALHECTEVLNENLRWRHGNVGKQDDDELLADAA